MPLSATQPREDSEAKLATANGGECLGIRIDCDAPTAGKITFCGIPRLELPEKSLGTPEDV